VALAVRLQGNFTAVSGPSWNIPESQCPAANFQNKAIEPPAARTVHAVNVLLHTSIYLSELDNEMPLLPLLCVLLRSAIVLLCILQMLATAVTRPLRPQISATWSYSPWGGLLRQTVR
jgi:hypothetical protein